MESLFFNAGAKHYRCARFVIDGDGEGVRVDVSNGVLFFCLVTAESGYELRVRNHDRLAMLTIVRKGSYTLVPDVGEAIVEGEERSTVLAAGRSDLALQVEARSRIFALAVGDFFLKRYLSGLLGDPLDRLYRRLQEVTGVRRIDSVPTDALSHHLVDRIVRAGNEGGGMAPLRLEREVTTLWLHRLALMAPEEEGIDAETLRIARCARDVLTTEYANPPTIPMLARRCATNATKLKQAFKKVHKKTVGAYVRALRLQQANELLKNRDLAIGEVARRVGYAHQGHFGRLFYEAYGIHPRDLRN
ncbi:helix-turn-helix transcriptional regulator [Hydrogenimonas sp.]